MGMIDREKVVKGLTAHVNGGCNKNDCPWFECENDGCIKSMFDAAIKLLKEQEAVEPIKQTEQTEWTVCGHCRKHLISKWMFCPYCGRAVKRDD